MHSSTFARRLLLNVLILTGVALLLAACGLASEPPIVRTQALATTTPTAPPDLGYPPARVNIARGAAIYNDPQGCQLCHGAGGRWDGPSAVAFACTPDLADADLNRGKSILAWFAITTNGNNGAPTCLMPPWKGRLDEQERWDVTSYAYSLNYTAGLLRRGQEVWAQHCAACHGDRAAGDGPQAAVQPRPAPDFRDPAYLIAKSDTELWRAVTNGTEGSGEHVFGEVLSDEERWAAVAYARALTWDGVETLIETPAPLATEEATPLPGTATPAATPETVPTATPTTMSAAMITVHGRMTGGTEGIPLPTGQGVTLRVIEQTADGPRDVERFEAATEADGTFTFGAVPRQEGLIYVAVTTFSGILQFSTPVRVTAESGDTLDLPLTVFATTADPSVIQVDVERLFIDPIGADTAVVQQAMRFRNTSDRIYVTDQRTGSGERIALQIDLPRGAQGVNITEDLAASYVIGGAAGAPAVLGVLPVLPGEMPVFHGSYVLPFSGDLAFHSPTLYRINALTVNVPRGRAEIRDPRFVPDAPVELQIGIYDTYRLREPLQAGAGLSFVVNMAGSAAEGQRLLIILVVAAAFVALAGTVAVIWRLNRRDEAPPPPDRSQVLIRAIAELDDRYEAGEIAGDEYEARRAALKAKLAAALAEDEPDN